jgi:hypothetical protein
MSRIQEDGKAVDIPIKQGEMFLLIRGIHLIVLSASWGDDWVNIEPKRSENENDVDALWKCNTKLNITRFHLTDIGKKTSYQDLKNIMLWGSAHLSKFTGHVMEVDWYRVRKG